jgi:hypothetical protein
VLPVRIELTTSPLPNRKACGLNILIEHRYL